MKRVLCGGIVSCLVMLGAGSLAFAVEQCKGTEGVNSEWQVQWIKTDKEPVGKKEAWTVSQTNGQATLTANLTVYRGKSFLAAERHGSNNNDCNYIGQEVNGTVTGQYYCKSGGPYNWQMTCTK